MNLYFLGDNNHLGVVVRYLEVIYTTLDYPKAAPALNVSLRDSGKSRADLWAFAAHVALERTIERANWGCEYDFNLRKQQTLLESREKCDIKLTSHFPARFMYGRTDCVPRSVVIRKFYYSLFFLYSFPYLQQKYGESQHAFQVRKRGGSSIKLGHSQRHTRLDEENL